MTANLTPWFSGRQKPVRAGVYERKYSETGSAYWLWSGEFWAVGGFTNPNDCLPSGDKAYAQDLPWRGLAADPVKGAK